jgi:hypothetical protein
VDGDGLLDGSLHIVLLDRAAPHNIDREGPARDGRWGIRRVLKGATGGQAPHALDGKNLESEGQESLTHSEANGSFPNAPPRDHEDWRAPKEVCKLVCIQGGTGHDEAEVGALADHLKCEYMMWTPNGCACGPPEM